MKSRLLSAFEIPIFFGRNPGTTRFVKEEISPSPTPWYPRAPKGEAGWEAIPRNEVAFVHNLESVIGLIKADGGKVVMVAFRANPKNEYSEESLKAFGFEEQILSDLSKTHGMPFAPFPASIIPPSSWLDGCHTDEIGNREKAKHVLAYIESLLQPAPAAK